MNSLNYKPNKDFPFSKVSLGTPSPLQGGAYFSKVRIELQDDTFVPLLVQTPKCSTKNGIHKTEKKIYCDLKFSRDNDSFVTWVKNLEERIQNLIYDKRTVWFHNDMDFDTIDYHWQRALRLYKGDNHLLRCGIQRPKNIRGRQMLQVYDEEKHEDEESKLTLDDIKKDVNVISILEVQGLKFTTQSFNLEICLRQVMVLKDKPIFNKCLIRTPYALANTSQTNEQVVKEPLDSKPKTPTAEDKAEIQVEGESDVGPTDSNETNAETEVQRTVSSIDTKDTEDGATADPTPDRTQQEKEATEEVELEIREIAETQNDGGEAVPKNMDSLEECDPAGPTPEEEGNISEETSSLEKKDELMPVDLQPPADSALMVLKKPNEVYIEIYKQARRKAKEARKKAILAYLEAKKIKTTYLLDDVESSDDDLDNYSDISELGES